MPTVAAEDRGFFALPRQGCELQRRVEDKARQLQESVNKTMTALQRWWKRLAEFLFPPETDKWLAVLRIGMGL